MTVRKRVAFVTIGQAPRDDMLPEMLARIGPGIEAVEVGALDGLTAEEIARLAPAPDDHALVSRLRDGTEATIGKRWVTARLRELMTALDASNPALVVLLCTGHFDGIRSQTLLVEAQRMVDAMTEAFAEDGRTVGVMVPLARQVDEFHLRGGRHAFVMAHASPYSGGRVEDAARELEKTDLIVMHCMGYDEAMRRRVADVTGKPVLLARRVVADAVAALIG